MLNTATIIAHIMYRNGAVLNFSDILRNLDLCLESASNGAYSLGWDSEDLMVAEFGQTRVILVAGHQAKAGAPFSFSVAVSPIDQDAVACPHLSSMHRHLIQNLVSHFEQPSNSNGVLWQRAEAPISPEAVEQIVEALADRLALLDGSCGWLPVGPSGIENAQLLPTTSLSLKLRKHQSLQAPRGTRT